MDKESPHCPGLKGHNGLQGKDVYFSCMIVNSTKMEPCFKSCPEARPGFSVLKEPDQSERLKESDLKESEDLKESHPSKSTWPVVCHRRFPFQYLKLLICCFRSIRRTPRGTTALQNHTASIFPQLQPGMKLHWHHATWSFTESIKFKTEAVIGYVSICYPSAFNTRDIILLSYGKLARLGFFFHSWSSSIEQNAIGDDSTALGKGMMC